MAVAASSCREGLLDADGKPLLQDFDPAFANMFPLALETVEAVKTIRRLHDSYPPDKPKGRRAFSRATVSVVVVLLWWFLPYTEKWLSGAGVFYLSPFVS